MDGHLDRGAIRVQRTGGLRRTGVSRIPDLRRAGRRVRALSAGVWDPALCRTDVAGCVRALLGLRQRATRDGIFGMSALTRKRGHRDGRGGAVAIVQRNEGAIGPDTG